MELLDLLDLASLWDHVKNFLQISDRTSRAGPTGIPRTAPHPQLDPPTARFQRTGVAPTTTRTEQSTCENKAPDEPSWTLLHYISASSGVSHSGDICSTSSLAPSCGEINPQLKVVQLKITQVS